MTNKAREFAIKWHGDQMYGDKPYVYHLDQVADIVSRDNQGRSSGTMQWLIEVAYLHDCAEDCGVTYYQLADLFGIEVAHSVLLLTKSKDVLYDDYINRLKQNFYARTVKIADTKANLKQSILDNDTKRIVKYAKQLMLLEE